MKMLADNVMQSRFDGVSVDGNRDQYADGRAAKVWEIFIGDKNSRHRHNYKHFLLELLRSKRWHRIVRCCLWALRTKIAPKTLTLNS